MAMTCFAVLEVLTGNPPIRPVEFLISKSDVSLPDIVRRPELSREPIIFFCQSATFPCSAVDSKLQTPLLPPPSADLCTIRDGFFTDSANWPHWNWTTHQNKGQNVYSSSVVCFRIFVVDLCSSKQPRSTIFTDSKSKECQQNQRNDTTMLCVISEMDANIGSCGV